jgi:hypothetical protein
MKRAFRLDIPVTLEEVCHPYRTALLVYDMQVGIASAVKGARRGGYRIFFSRHLSLPNQAAGACGSVNEQARNARWTLSHLVVVAS